MTYLILLVEDDGSLNEILVDLLREPGFQVLPYKDGDDARTAILDDWIKYDLAIIDRSLPGFSGDDLLRLSKRMHPDIPVIIMSLYGYMPDGADELFGKGLGSFKEDLISMVNKYLKK